MDRFVVLTTYAGAWLAFWAGLYAWVWWRSRCPQCRTAFTRVVTEPDWLLVVGETRRSFTIVCKRCGRHESAARPGWHPSRVEALTTSGIVGGAVATTAASWIACCDG